MQTITLTGSALTIEEVVAVARHRAEVALDADALRVTAECRKWLEENGANRSIYGVNTGFGALAGVTISAGDMRKLTYNLVKSHAAGVGDYLPTEVVRGAMLIRANSLLKGVSGVRPKVVQLLADMLNEGVHPLVPEYGSVGASGDLAPLCHIALILSRGEDGESFGFAEYQGETLAGAEAMKQAGLEPIVLAEKEGLALSNGTAGMASLLALATYDAHNLMENSLCTSALSMESIMARPEALDARIHEARGHANQIKAADALRRLTNGSTLMGAFDAVQDAYSYRCTPQVLGACCDGLTHMKNTLAAELNAATDNPLIFYQDGEVLSGGNFHGEPLALASDFLSIGVAEVGSISERRVFRVLDESLSRGLPAMLDEDNGVNSGMMIAQYTAAALVSDNKTLAHPDSVDSIPTCANQEDHVSMGFNAARHARQIVRNVEYVLGIEAICGARGLDFRLRDGAGAPGTGTRAVYDAIRERIPAPEGDVYLSPILEQARELVHDAVLTRAAEEAVGGLL